MKRLAIYALSLLALPAVWSCKSFQGAQVTVRPNPLEVHADSVAFTVRTVVPPQSGIKKGGTYRGQLVIRNGSNTFQMSQVNVAYEQYPNIKKQGATLSASASQPFQEAMDGGMLTAVNRYERRGKVVELPNIELAPCCITTSRLVCESFQLVGSEHEYQSQVPVTLEAKFQFPQNVGALQPTELQKAEIRAIADFLTRRYTATRISISGFASPEGPLRRNTELSIQRSREVRDWLMTQLRENGYTSQLDSNFFNITTTAEDWAGFKANLDRTNYPEEVKRQIIEIISAGYNEDEKERKIMALVGGAVEVEFILAPLRRATIRLEGTNAAHSDGQIAQFVGDFAAGRKSGAELQQFFSNKEELLFAALGQQDRAAKKKLLTEFTRIYPDDFRGYNLLGVLAIEDGLVDEALDFLSIADRKNPNNHAVLNNLGVVYAMKRNYAEAMTRLQTSYSAKNSAQAAFNMGVILEKRAQYGQASDMFEMARDLPCANYNAGLCKLLMGDLAGAKADLENAIRSDRDRALNYYVLAIVGARSADNNLLLLNIKRAVQLDNVLTDKAGRDLEFRRYFDNAEFQVALRP